MATLGCTYQMSRVVCFSAFLSYSNSPDVVYWPDTVILENLCELLCKQTGA